MPYLTAAFVFCSFDRTKIRRLFEFTKKIKNFFQIFSFLFPSVSFLFPPFNTTKIRGLFEFTKKIKTFFLNYSLLFFYNCLIINVLVHIIFKKIRFRVDFRGFLVSLWGMGRGIFCKKSRFRFKVAGFNG